MGNKDNKNNDEQKTQEDKKDSRNFDPNLLLDNSPEASEEYLIDASILHHKIKKDGVKNIALVGSFGAGKSSMINTYLDEYRSDKKILGFNNKNNTYTRISLSSFNGIEYKETDVERSILQQLLYSQPKKKFPNSKIERTTGTSWWMFLLALSITSLIALLSLFFLQLRDVIVLEFISTKYLFLSMMIIFFFLMWYIVHFKKIQRVKYKNFELEIDNSEANSKSGGTQSLINRFVDELLYFFECTKINLVIFEDLDRLEFKGKNGVIIDRSSEILVKLRELNTIVNNTDKYKKRVTFLYVIKDSLIKNQEERGKFFEFILPIVPILSPTNAANKIFEIQHKMKKNPELELHGEFIHTIASRIPNMRILKNTFNDYIITRTRIFPISTDGRLKNENLFALCLYKNLFPYDYSLLEQGKGLIPLIIDSTDLAKEALNKTRNEIKEIEKLIVVVDKNQLQDFDELKMIFLAKAYKTNSKYSGYYNNQQGVDINSITTFENLDFNNLKHPSGSYKINWENEPKLPNGDSFFEREKLIGFKAKSEREKLLKRIENRKNNIKKYSNMNFNELIKELGTDFCFNRYSENDIKSNCQKQLSTLGEDNLMASTNRDFELRNQLDYLRLLVQNFWIDESYEEYTSNYNSDILSAKDLEFIKKVQQGSADFYRNIDNVEQVSKLLTNSDFANYAIFNNSILANLSEIKKLSMDKFKNIIKVLCEDSENAKDTLVKFIQLNDTGETAKLIDEIMSNATVNYNFIIENEMVSDDKKNVILIAMMRNDFDLSKYETVGILSDYIGKLPNYIEFFEQVNFEEAEKFLSFIRPKFLELLDNGHQITKFIVKENLFDINIKNLKIILNVSGKKSGFYSENYFFIKENNLDLNEYINKNLSTYIEKVFISPEIINSKESEEVIFEFLKTPDLDLQLKNAIIRKYNFIVYKVEEFEHEIYPELVLNSKISPTWENILTIFNALGSLEGNLKEYILNAASDISGVFFEKDNKNNRELIKFFKELVNVHYSEEELELFKIILDKINANFPISEEYENDHNFSLCISKAKIQFSSEAFDFLIDKKISLMQYINFYEGEILKIFEKFFNNMANAETINEIFLSNEISLKFKEIFIKQFGNEVQLQGLERRYYDLIINSNISIPEDLLYKFANSNNLLTYEKCELIEKTQLTWENNDEFNEFIINIFPELNGIESENKIILHDLDNIVVQDVIKKFAKIKSFKVTKNKNKFTLNRI